MCGRSFVSPGRRHSSPERCASSMVGSIRVREMLATLYAGFLNAAFLISAMGIGAPLVRLGMKREEAGSFLLFAVSVGMGALSLLTLAAGALRLFNTWSAVILMCAGVLFGLLELALHPAGYKALARPRAGRSSTLAIHLVGGAVGAAFSQPRISADQLWTHPARDGRRGGLSPRHSQDYIRHGGIDYIPFIPYSNLPLGTEMLSPWACSCAQRPSHT